MLSWDPSPQCGPRAGPPHLPRPQSFLREALLSSGIKPLPSPPFLSAQSLSQGWGLSERTGLASLPSGRSCCSGSQLMVVEGSSGWGWGWGGELGRGRVCAFKVQLAAGVPHTHTHTPHTVSLAHSHAVTQPHTHTSGSVPLSLSLSLSPSLSTGTRTLPGSVLSPSLSLSPHRHPHWVTHTQKHPHSLPSLPPLSPRSSFKKHGLGEEGQGQGVLT